MSKVIGLSGPQGGGKSTLLKGLKEKGYHVDDFKVSREVQKRLGWDSLEHAYDSAETMMQFQNTILTVKRDRDLDNIMSDEHEIILTERTFADIAVYTQMWTEKLLLADKWDLEQATKFTLNFYRDAGELQYLYAGNIYLPSMPHIKWEDDPHRAKQEDILEFEANISMFFDSWQPAEIPFFHVTAASVEDRIEETVKWLTLELA